MRRGTPDQFSFRHTLIHDAACASLLQRERKGCHRQVGETIELMQSNALEGFVADLALHFFEAEVWDKALEYSRRAGENTQRTYSEREAVIHFPRAIEAVLMGADSPNTHATQRWRLKVARGRVHGLLGQPDAARSEFAKARAMIDEFAPTIPDEQIGRDFVDKALGSISNEIPT